MTRINVLFNHRLRTAWSETNVLARLAPTLPAALAVRNYWIGADPDPPDPRVDWQAEAAMQVTPKMRRFSAPGRLFLTVMPHVAMIRTGARWSGFLSIEPLRKVHVAAFDQIAAALGADEIVYRAGLSDALDDRFLADCPFDECVNWLRQEWGPPRSDFTGVGFDGAKIFEMWFLTRV